MSSFEVISTDPYIYWPDPMDSLALPWVDVYGTSGLDARAAAAILKIWLRGCRPQIDAMGEEEWVRFVAALFPEEGTITYQDVEDFARFYVHYQVRSGIHVLDGRDVPFNAPQFTRVSVDFRWRGPQSWPRATRRLRMED